MENIEFTVTHGPIMDDNDPPPQPPKTDRGLRPGTQKPSDGKN